MLEHLCVCVWCLQYLCTYRSLKIELWITVMGIKIHEPQLLYEWDACVCVHTHKHTCTHTALHTHVSLHTRFVLPPIPNPGRFEGFHFSFCFCWPVLKLLGSNKHLCSYNSKITASYVLPTPSQTLCSVPYMHYLMTLPRNPRYNRYYT